MATSLIPTLEEFERSHVARTGVRALASAALLLTAYYVVPVAPRAHEAVGLRLGVSMALFVAVLSFEVRSIAKHARPMLRAVVAMATVIPLFLVLFAWIYLTMSRSDPAAFGQALDRDSALYFTVTVFSTVGFGDIVAKSDVARLGGHRSDARRSGGGRCRDPADPRGRKPRRSSQEYSTRATGQPGRCRRRIGCRSPRPGLAGRSVTRLVGR